MKRLLLSLSASLAFAALASAAPWQSITQRKAILDERIDMGIRNGLLTRPEAIVVRGDFDTLVRLEQTYLRSGGGLTAKEQLDLDRRFEALFMRVKFQKHDAQVRVDPNWVPINQRQARIYGRIDDGIRNGTITKAESVQLRGEFQTLVRLEAEYRRSGGVFTLQEREDLDRRLSRLSQRVVVERRDDQRF
jgi:hypothetical protein